MCMCFNRVLYVCVFLECLIRVVTELLFLQSSEKITKFSIITELMTEFLRIILKYIYTESLLWLL